MKSEDLKLFDLQLFQPRHGNAESPATMFMAELAKGRRSAPIVEPPLLVREFG